MLTTSDMKIMKIEGAREGVVILVSFLSPQKTR